MECTCLRHLNWSRRTNNIGLPVEKSQPLANQGIRFEWTKKKGSNHVHTLSWNVLYCQLYIMWDATRVYVMWIQWMSNLLVFISGALFNSVQTIRRINSNPVHDAQTEKKIFERQTHFLKKSFLALKHEDFYEMYSKFLPLFFIYSPLKFFFVKNPLV